MNKNVLYRSIPKVDILLADEGIKVLIEAYSRESVMEAIHSEMEKLRAYIGTCDDEEKAKHQIALLNENIAKAVAAMHTPNMKKVINGTGTILHTNLGRAPVSYTHLTGHEVSQDMLDLADYATMMMKVKHPYDRKVMAREGIEF